MKIILSFDVEGDLYKYIHSPYIWHHSKRFTGGVKYSYSGSKLVALKNLLKWKLANKILNRAQGYQGIKNIIYFLEKTELPASLNICGYLYNPQNEFKEIKLSWAIGKLKKDPYYFSSKKQKGLLDFSKIIKASKLINSKKIDWGLHGYLHEAFPLEDIKTRESLLKEGINAVKKLGLNPQSFVPPFNMFSNKNFFQILDLLKKNNINTVRFAGEDDYLGDFNHSLEICAPIKKNGVNIVRLSDSLEGTDSKSDVLKLVSRIKSNYNPSAIYCIMCHDYSFKTPDNLFLFFSEIKKLQKKIPLKFTNLKKL